MSTSAISFDPTSSQVADAQDAAVSKRRNRMLAVLLTGQFMTNADASIVNVAGPTIQRHLHASGAGLQLIISGYTIAYAVLLITGARLGDDRGHRRMFMGGLAGFTVASLLCGLAPDATTLIVARLLQGAAAAMMIPQVLSLIQQHYQGASRARALSLFAAAISVGFVLGQVLGGVLVSADLFGLSWRTVFLVNVPIGAVLLGSAAKHLPAHESTERRRLDIGGTGLLLTSMLALVLPLVLGREEGWPAWTVLALVAVPFLLAVFVVFEGRELRRGRQPLFDIGVLRNRGFAFAVGTQFLMMATFAGHLFALALFIQEGLHVEAVEAGLCFVPMGVAFAITSLAWPRIPAAAQRRVLPLGLALAAIGYVLTGLVLGHQTSMNAWTFLVPAIGGFGLGFGASPLIGRALAQVQPQHIASASGMVTTNVQTAIVVGTASFGSLYLAKAADGAGAALQATFLLLAAVSAVASVMATRLR